MLSGFQQRLLSAFAAPVSKLPGALRLYRSQRTSQTHIKERFHASFHHCINRHCHVLHLLQYSSIAGTIRRTDVISGRPHLRTRTVGFYHRVTPTQTVHRGSWSDTHLTVRLTPRWMLPAGILHNSNLITAGFHPPSPCELPTACHRGIPMKIKPFLSPKWTCVPAMVISA